MLTREDIAKEMGFSLSMMSKHKKNGLIPEPKRFKKSGTAYKGFYTDEQLLEIKQNFIDAGKELSGLITINQITSKYAVTRGTVCHYIRKGEFIKSVTKTRHGNHYREDEFLEWNKKRVEEKKVKIQKTVSYRINKNKDKIISMYEKGHKIVEIADHFNCSPPMLSDVLKNVKRGRGYNLPILKNNRKKTVHQVFTEKIENPMDIVNKAFNKVVSCRN